MWTITRIVKKGDYLYGVCKEHPKAYDHGYVLLHRLVMENHLGRELAENEVVHHKNHNKHDNRVENLEVMDSSEHLRLHFATGRTMVKFNCARCGKEYLREKRLVNRSLAPTCSRKCNGTRSRKLQLDRKNKTAVLVQTDVP